MKIIYIANARVPTEKAHGIQIMKMCESFALHNMEVELVLPKRFNEIKEDSFKYYGIKRNFKIKKLSCLDLIPLDKYIGHLGFWIESVTFYFFTFFHLFFKKVDIIYTRDKLFLFYTLFFKNLIYEAHGFPKKYFFYHLFLKRLKKIIVITQKLKGFFVGKGISSDKILVAPDGVDLEMFNIEDKKGKYYREEFNLPQNKKIIGYVGRLETLGKEKGINILIKSFKILTEQFNNILLCIIGGPEKRIIEYQKFVQELKLENKIKFLGQAKYNLIPKILKSCDVLIMPYPYNYHYAFYMSPLKMFEYMASKRPIIASNLPSIREVLNENNSFLVEPDNPEKLAKGIENILKKPNLSAKISNQAFLDVQKYTWQKRSKKILSFINQT